MNTAALLKYFPYERMRREQEAIMSTVYNALSSKRDVLIEAASGVGKTVAVLTATMPFIEDGHKLVYIARTHMELDKVVEELVKINERGCSVRGVVFRGRSSLCINPMVATLPSQLIDEFCSMLRGFNVCEYFVNSQKCIVDVFNKKGEELKRVCLRKGVCPYEALLSSMPNSDVIVMTYNYLIISELREKIFSLATHSSDKAPIIVLDEAHNIQEIVHSINSVHLDFNDIIHAVSELEVVRPSRIINSFKDFIKNMINTSETVRRGSVVPLDLTLSAEELMSLKSLVNDALHLNISKGETVIRGLLYLSALLRLLGKVFEGNYVLLLRKERDSLALEVFNPNPMGLKRLVKRRLSIIAMSATLSPLDFYNKVLNMRSPLIKRIYSPYAKNALFIVYTELDTSFKKRGKLLYTKTLSLIADLDSYVPEEKSIAIFVPSYEFLEELIERGLVYKVGRKVITDSDLSTPDILDVADSLYVGVLGGRLSEGVDLRVSLCLIVGVPYSMPDYRLMRTLKEYSKIFPGRARRYAYVFPAIRRAIQASGRLLRRPEDRGIVIFADRRYLKLLKYFPKWMIPRIKVVKRRGELLKYVSLFSY